MGMMDRLAGLLGRERRSDATDPSWAAIAPGIGWPNAVSARAAESLSAVLACSTVIASSLASIPALIYRREGDNRVEAMTHPLRAITRGGVNEQMTWPDFLEHLIASALLTGNGLAEVIRSGNGQLSGFRFIPWGMVSVAYLASDDAAFVTGTSILVDGGLTIGTRASWDPNEPSLYSALEAFQ